MDQAQATSFLQMNGPTDAEDRLAKLGPILDKLKTLDPKTAQMLSKMVGGESFLQVSGDVDPEEKMMKLDHVLEKLRTLDPKTFGMLNNMIDSARGGMSFMQVNKPDMDEQLMKLQP